MKRFDKKSLTIPEQIDLLKSRGMVISDVRKAANYLSNISYYRLSAYWYTFLELPQNGHVFINGTTFDKAIDTYVFDRKLRLMIFDEIERIEIALRTQIIYHYCSNYGNNWYEDRALYKGPNYYYKFNSLLSEEIKRSREVFISHYRNTYNEPPSPPAWMALELASFGQLSMLYKNLKSNNAKKNVAKHFGIHENVLASWLESLSYIRNTCAHHSRLWNKKMPKPLIIPKVTTKKWISIIPDESRNNRVYFTLVSILYLLRQVVPKTTFGNRVKNLINQYPQIPKYYMGFPDNWDSDPFWVDHM